MEANKERRRVNENKGMEKKGKIIGGNERVMERKAKEGNVMEANEERGN